MSCEHCQVVSSYLSKVDPISRFLNFIWICEQYLVSIIQSCEQCSLS